MSMTVGGSFIFANIRVQSLVGVSCAGFHQLVFNLEFRLPARAEEQPIVLIDLGGNVTVQGTGAQPRDLGPVRPTWSPASVDSREIAMTTQLGVALDLDSRRLEALEDIRAGGALTFCLNLWGTASSARGLEPVRDSVSQHVNQGTWVETLNQMAFGRTILLEIPMPVEGAAPQLARSVEYLGEAHAAMLQGAWSVTVGHCRRVLDALQEFSSRNVTGAASAPADRHKRTKVQRYNDLLQPVKDVCNPAPHGDENAACIQWDRIDAQAALMLTSALVKRFAALRNP